jgi:hypothetical protein
LRADSGYDILPRVLTRHDLTAFRYFHSSGFDRRRLRPESSINKQGRRPPLAASGKLPKAAFEQDFLNFTEATATAQPEVNHFTRRKTWQQNR